MVQFIQIHSLNNRARLGTSHSLFELHVSNKQTIRKKVSSMYVLDVKFSCALAFFLKAFQQAPRLRTQEHFKDCQESTYTALDRSVAATWHPDAVRSVVCQTYSNNPIGAAFLFKTYCRLGTSYSQFGMRFKAPTSKHVHICKKHECGCKSLSS